MKLRRSRRIISGLLLLWLGLLQFPLPFAVRATDTAISDKDLSTPYPCMNRPCGCRSAEQCWKSCCCTTKAERIAFVLDHGLEMPEILLAAAEPVTTPAKPLACCLKKSTGAATCDQLAEGDSPNHDAKADRQPEKPRKGVVLFDSVMKCKGLSFQLAQLAGAVVSCPPPVVAVKMTEPGRLILQDDILLSVALAPPAPPPRIGRES